MDSSGPLRALLLLDTCGERASLSVVRDGRVVVSRSLEEKTASGALLGAVQKALGEAGVAAGELGGVGLVNGPGSFTGVRVGVAMAKGLCEALRLPLAAVSRLAVLAEAGAVEDGFAVLSAGRDQVYVREIAPGEHETERMLSAKDLCERARGREVVYAEERVGDLLGETLRLRFVALSASASLQAVQRCLAEGGSDLQRVDANYVRPEEAIYPRPRATGTLCDA
jgi:tRNA threonylcarbamoyladenosine biosynthesis protein TsaB